jgi:hypothetical protein
MIKNALDIAFENMENPGKNQWKNDWKMVNTRICEAKRIILERPGKSWKKLENWKNHLKNHWKILEKTGKLEK